MYAQQNELTYNCGIVLYLEIFWEITNIQFTTLRNSIKIPLQNNRAFFKTKLQQIPWENFSRNLLLAKFLGKRNSITGIFV